MSDINWHSPNELESITGYDEYILEIDSGIGPCGKPLTQIVHAIHLDSINTFWDITADPFGDDGKGFIYKDNILKWAKL